MPVELTINGYIAEIFLDDPDKRNVLDCVSSAQAGEAELVNEIYAGFPVCAVAMPLPTCWRIYST